MAKASKFVGARLEPETYRMVADTAAAEHVDRTLAMKMLIREGWREYRLRRALEAYARGEVSLDRAAQMANRNLHEMMAEAAAHGIRSTESVAELREGLRRLSDG